MDITEEWCCQSVFICEFGFHYGAIMFIVFEGIDGSGKTLQSKLLYESLTAKGIKASLTKEPTEGPIGRLIRQNAAGVAGSFIKVNKKIADRGIDGVLVNQFAMQALFVSDRLYHIEQFIEPELAAGHVVISDRYMLSTIAYGMAAGISKKWLVALNKGLIEPDITFLLDLDVKAALKRIGKRQGTKELFEKEEFLNRVRRAYLQLAKGRRGCFIVDASKDKEEVAADINRIVNKYL